MANLTTLEALPPSTYGDLGLGSYSLPGIGGRMKDSPEDFLVTEVPAYEPSGSGDHLYLWVEKKGWSHDQLLQHLTKALGVPGRDIGTAGMKDTHAITRQWLSVPAQAESQLSQVATHHCQILQISRHRNKLSTGHLRGNRFAIRIQDVHPEATARMTAIVTRLQETGVPNFYGHQRFGSKGDTAAMGRALLLGQDHAIPRKWLMHHNRRLALSALQSELFNRYLLRRWLTWGPSEIHLGDVMSKPSGASFVVTDLETEKLRFQKGEIVPTGPMFGSKVMTPTGTAAELEDKILHEAELDRAAFQKAGKHLPGARRATVIGLEEFSWSHQGTQVECQFFLPAGSYATVVMAEFMKPLESSNQRGSGGVETLLQGG